MALKLKLKEKQELFKLLQQAFFFKPGQPDTYEVQKNGSAFTVTWNVVSQYNFKHAARELQNYLSSVIAPDEKDVRFGAVKLRFMQDQDDTFVLETGKISTDIEARFDLYGKEDTKILSILAQRSVDFETVRKKLAELAGIPLENAKLKLVPSEILDLRVLINSYNVRLSEIDVSRLNELTYAFSIYESNQVQENKRTDFSGIEDWDTSNVVNMTGVFAGCVNFNQDISRWNTSKVKKTDVMFASCKKFNQNISAWDMSRVESMKGMFYKCESFNCNLSSWNTANVKDMSSLFFKCKSFNQDLSHWNTEKVTVDEGAFTECGLQDDFRPISPTADFKRDYYNHYVGPDAKRWQRTEQFKKVAMVLAICAMLVIVLVYGQ